MASDWLMRGPFQGIGNILGYTRLVIPVGERIAQPQESSEPCPDDAAARTAAAAGARRGARGEVGVATGSDVRCGEY